MALLPENLSFSRKILPIIAVVALIGAVIYVLAGLPDRELSDPESQPPSANGELANSARVAGAGVVEPSSEVIDIGTAISGLVTSLEVAPGDFVGLGQPLFVVDQRSARARLQEANAAIGEARAAIRDAQATSATAQQQLALYSELDDPAAVSRAEVIRAEGEASAASTRLELARARLAAAQAQASSARTELERLTVRAPIAGEILAVNIRPGEFVSNVGGAPEAFIQMGETRPLHIRIDVDEDEAMRVERGASAFVSPRGDAGNQIEATFVRAEPLIVPKRSLTNSAAERVDVRVLQLIYALPDDARGSFTVGQQVDAFIPAVESAQ
ncbi:efflux RND transporter periplasmic adaptor subunit [Erythrobacter sp. HA6-11]